MFLTANVYKEVDLKPFTFSHQVDNSQTLLFLFFYSILQQKCFKCQNTFHLP